MGYISKEGYERKREWRARHNKEQQESCNKLSDSDHEWVQELHSLRHDFHCDSGTMNRESGSETHQKLYAHIGGGRYCGKIENTELLNIANDTFKHLIHEENLLDDIYLDELEGELEALEGLEGDEAYLKLQELHDEQKEQINNICREFIKKVNEKFNLNY